MTTVTRAYGPGDRVTLTVRLADDYGGWLAHPGDIGEIMQVIPAGDPGIERGACKCDGPFYAVHFEDIAHANLEHVCEHQITAAQPDPLRAALSMCNDILGYVQAEQRDQKALRHGRRAVRRHRGTRCRNGRAAARKEQHDHNRAEARGIHRP